MTIFFAFLFVYSLIHIIFWFKDNKHTNNVINDIYENVIENSIEIDNSTNIEKEDKIINFDTLIKKNKDTKGWLEVKGTNINYPFVQSKDNKYYLTHSFDKKYTDAGWVFLDYRNNIKEFDRNTIIYAHARKDRTMFGSLKNILKSGWLDDTNNYVIKLSTEYENTLWQVFSIYHIPTTNDYIQVIFNNDNEYLEFLNLIKNRSKHNFNTNVSETDKILTLSTCYTNNEKLVLHAKLIKKEARN